MWLKVLRQNLSQLTRRTKGSQTIEQKNGNSNNAKPGTGNKTNNNGVEVNRNEEQNNGPIDIKNQSKKKSPAPGSGPLLHQAEVSSSQLEFFKMLDEKIENGPDYDESLDASARVERVSSLLRRWELASVTWSSSVSELNNSNSNSTSNSPLSKSNQRARCSSLSNSRNSLLTAKDREGMRNIIGGRPESAPIFTRNANRVDGLQEPSQCPSPNMPRHVLESISQSPTHSNQSQRNTPPYSSSPTIKYMDFNNHTLLNKSSSSSSSSPPPSPSSSSSIVNFQVNIKKYEKNKSPTPPTTAPTTTNYNSNNFRERENFDFINSQHQIYREQYLQQTGMINPKTASATAPGSKINTNNNKFSTQSSSVNVLRNNPYVKNYQIHNSTVNNLQTGGEENQFVSNRKSRGFNNSSPAQMT